ncbi:putative secreted protein with PEP-CTERM sorting signal [Pseudoduganella flava]|nr:MHFG family PEP-CTERM protein [Pseudoduganella flava]TWI50109.1 putative secreted protein with PEP-CTERM sorting signal [Pseudoduganella flava]
MQILLAAAAAALLTQPECSWNRPGADPYRGTVAAALERYRDIPRADRVRIAERIAAGTPDDDVRIGRDTIDGQFRYRDEIRDMHFGGSATPPRLCRAVNRHAWRADHTEPAAVYCSGEHCVVIPRVCGNVSRIERIRPKVPVTVDITLPAPPPTVPSPQPFDWATGTELGLADHPVPAEPEDETPPPARDLVQPTPPLVWHTDPVPPAPVPEPSGWAMLVTGLAACAWCVRRRRCR